MEFPSKYNCLTKNSFELAGFSIVPIRYEDRLAIMKWRNEQIYHLRQEQPLTEENQNDYFNNVVSKLFNDENPNQLLFSYLENGTCIGYGGLVHINWHDKNAEISFIMDTSIEKDHFEEYWSIFLRLLEKVAFDILKFHKIYTYAFDLRPHLYTALEKVGFIKEAVLKEHCFFDDKFIDVVIHRKINDYISIRLAEKSDELITFEWTNDTETRKNSFSNNIISFEEHSNWWNSKIRFNTYFIVEVNSKRAGIIRFDKHKDYYTIGINIAPEFRNRGFSSKFLFISCKKFRKNHNEDIFAFIKPENLASIKSFEKAGFVFIDKIEINSIDALRFQYN
ncbi:MAG: GNAT family N-acetyltransferase [Chitinophagales bacterium]|nr:GNAT family N-acetyltransferase [Chitinophagales bacterium]MCO5247791.1 GNAT family N-acetyltransferase [Chitinophagales bacterium]